MNDLPEASPRELLPNRRQTQTLTFMLESLKYECSFSNFDDGKLAEVFIQVGSAGSPVEALGRDMAVVTSLALQFGCPVHVLKDALTQGRDGPAGPLGVLLEEIAEDGAG